MSEDPYYAKDGKVWKRPVRTAYAGGTTIEIGFPVCVPSEFCPGEGETIAKLMNRGSTTEEKPMPKSREDAMTLMRKYSALDDIDSRLNEIAMNGDIQIVFKTATTIVRVDMHRGSSDYNAARGIARDTLRTARTQTVATIRALGFDAPDLDDDKEATQ